jgi:hypothetical protein
MQPRRTLTYVLCFLAGLTIAGAGGYAIAGGGSDGGSKSFVTVRPTAVGLPRIGIHGTVGAGDLAAPIRNYHDSGQYSQDLTKVDGRADSYLNRRVPKIRQKANQRCRSKSISPCPKQKLAMVLDIDETSLSNYAALDAANFTGATTALATSVVRRSSSPTPSTPSATDQRSTEETANRLHSPGTPLS